MIIATLQDKKHVVDILCSAFEPITEPNSINYIVKQDKHRSKRMRVLMEFIFDNCMDFGEVLLSNNRNACILMTFPHTEKLTFKKIKGLVRVALKCTGLKNAIKVLQRQAQLKKHHISEAYIHPTIMGAKNEVHGFGIGVRLIKQLIDHYEGNELPVIIQTTTDQNLKIYKRFGFEVFKKVDLKDFPLYFLRMN